MWECIKLWIRFQMSLTKNIDKIVPYQVKFNKIKVYIIS